MQDFTFHNPTKLVFGKSAMEKLAENAKNFGNKVLVTYGGGSIKKNGIYDKVMEQLEGFEVREFGGIEPNPRVETLQGAIELAREFEPDLLLAVGGGSVVDGTKLVAAAINYEGDPWEIVEEKKRPEKFVPIGVVLTLAATGTEMNVSAVITNWTEHKKDYFQFEEVRPKFSILDPQNTFTVPKDQSVYGVIDAFVHVMEQYMNTTLDAPLQDRFAESILKTLVEWGPKVLESPDDYNVRETLMWSATMALNDIIALGQAGDWATHMIEHEFSAFYDIPHAAGLAVIHPHWLEVVAKNQKSEKLVQFGKRIWGLTGTDEDIMNSAIAKTAEFFSKMGAKLKLSEWDIDREYFDEITERLLKRGVGEFELDEGQIRQILEKSL